MHEIRVSIIGLDTSHAIEFTRIIQAPECPNNHHVEGLRAVRCLRFETPFQNREGLDARQQQLEQWGVAVTESFEEAVEDCDALMLEINDPARHLEYFAKCAGLGKPIFLDKPLADTFANGERILAAARRQGTRFFSASSLRFVPQLDEACRALPQPMTASIYGPLQKAAAGSSIAWYGVHAFEMLQRAMGTGACSLLTRKDGCGAVVSVAYRDGRRGVVELTEDAWIYGGTLRTKQDVRPFAVDMSRAYTDLVTQIVRFFRGGTEPVSLESTREIMAMLDAAERSLLNGTEEPTSL
ncbi:MAG: Gfo/Idh/MocA family oxidoreductase [Armatimonadetes bacterium]|nr:Gfo/Idh/MocA family oxidoreductase [Armatimonadota bacterium]